VTQPPESVPGAERLAVSVTEAAQMLGISRTLAYRLVRTGELPSRRFQGRIIVPLVDLRALVDDRGSAGAG
jgi:excisionase family DNA binding protein